MRTIHQLVQEYIGWRCVSRGGCEPSPSLQFLLRKFAQWLEVVAQVTLPVQLTPALVQRWLQHESARPGAYSGRPLTAGSLQTQMQAIRAFCDWLHRRGEVPASVPEAFPKARRLPVTVKPALAHREMRRLLRRIPRDTPTGHRNRALGEFLYTSGVRIAEALALNLEDIDLDNGTARIRGKGQRDRVVPLGRRACVHLRTYLVSVRPLLLRSPEERAVWLGHKGKRLQYDCFFRQWRSITTAIALPIKVSAHTFRRSCATELHRSGASPWEIKELLGHRELDTLRYYIDLKISDLKRTHSRCHPRELGREGDC